MRLLLVHGLLASASAFCLTTPLAARVDRASPAATVPIVIAPARRLSVRMADDPEAKKVAAARAKAAADKKKEAAAKKEADGDGGDADGGEAEEDAEAKAAAEKQAAEEAAAKKAAE